MKIIPIVPTVTKDELEIISLDDDEEQSEGSENAAETSSLKTENISGVTVDEDFYEGKKSKKVQELAHKIHRQANIYEKAVKKIADEELNLEEYDSEPASKAKDENAIDISDSMIDSAQSKKDDAQTEEPLEVLDEIKKYSTNVPLDTSPL